jgi:hypothetical protein
LRRNGHILPTIASRLGIAPQLVQRHLGHYDFRRQGLTIARVLDPVDTWHDGTAKGNQALGGHPGHHEDEWRGIDNALQRGRRGL